MYRQKTSRATIMLLVCLLPLLFFLLLALFGVAVHPLLVPLLLIVCCLVMFSLMMGTCEHEQTSGHERVEREVEMPPEESAAPLEVGAKIEDVFRVHGRHRAGNTLILEGELLQDPDVAYAALCQRFADDGVTVLLQEGADGQPLLVLVPGELTPPVGKDRGPWLNLALLLLTFGTTTWAGALHAGVNLLDTPARFAAGLPYALSLLLILGAHELGHYFAARAHRMHVTLPYFIPVPFGLGTFGAFIQLKSPAQNRRALFDVGVAGPLAGLVFAIPALWFGLSLSSVLPPTEAGESMHGGANVGSSFLFALVAKLALGDALTEGHRLLLHPLAFAGWLGLLVTALNLLPIGQLDGGHIADAMFGRMRGAAISTAAMVALVLLGLFVWSGLLTWAVLVYFLAGFKGMPPLNDISRLDVGRLAVGVFAFVVLVLILAPVPHRLYDTFGIHCPYL